MVVADATLDVNDPNDRELGQRVFGCINYTTPGASSLDFRCRDQGFRSYRAASARSAVSSTGANLVDRDPSGCEGPECGGGGGIPLPQLPQGAKLATNSGINCNGEYRGIGVSEYSVVEFLGKASNPTPAIDALVTQFPLTVKEADLALINNDSLPDRVVLLQPQESWNAGPSADIYDAAQVEVCIRDANSNGLTCTPEARPRMVARGVYRDDAAHYEFRSASLAGITNVAESCDAAPEIVVASTGAGLGEEDPQTSNYDYAKDLSLMVLGKARLSSYNLPLSSLCLWPGSPLSSNQSICNAAPRGPAPLVMHASLGNFTSRIGRNPALSYPLDSVMLLRKESINSSGNYEIKHEVTFVSASNQFSLAHACAFTELAELDSYDHAIAAAE